MEALKVDKSHLPNLLTPEQVGQLFNLKTRQVKELARQGRIPAVKVGRLWRFPEDSLKAWLEKNQTTCVPEIHPNEDVAWEPENSDSQTPNTIQVDIDAIVDGITQKLHNNERHPRKT